MDEQNNTNNDRMVLQFLLRIYCFKGVQAPSTERLGVLPIETLPIGLTTPINIIYFLTASKSGDVIWVKGQCILAKTKGVDIHCFSVYLHFFKKSILKTNTCCDRICRLNENSVTGFQFQGLILGMGKLFLSTITCYV